MGKSFQKELRRRNKLRSIDFDFYSLTEMAEEGFNDEEISRNLDINISFVKTLRKEMEDSN
jgi:hypothetical protein